MRERWRSSFQSLVPRGRLRRWLCRKHKVKSGEDVRFLDERLWQGYESERLQVRKRSFA